MTAGAIVTVIFVAESVHVEVEVVEDVVEVVVVQVTVVVAAVEPQEARPNGAISKMKDRRRFTVPRPLMFEIPSSYGTISTLNPKIGY
jgi:hypothetical protein